MGDYHFQTDRNGRPYFSDSINHCNVRAASLQRSRQRVGTLARAGQVEVSIDGITREVVSLVNPTTAVRTFTYTNLGNGPHILQVRLAISLAHPPAPMARLRSTATACCWGRAM